MQVPSDKTLPHPRGTTSWWATSQGTIVMDGVEYTPTHPITKYGIWGCDIATSKSGTNSKL